MSQPASTVPPGLPRYCTLDEYFRLAEASLDKLEYRGRRDVPLGGEIVAVAGGTENHSPGGRQRRR